MQVFRCGGIIKEYNEKKKGREMFKKELGRSMIEMLAVLAIIGILSIGAVLGYNYAMRSWFAEKILNDVGTLGSTIQFRGRGYERGKKIPTGVFEDSKVKQIGNRVEVYMDNDPKGQGVRRDTFHIRVHDVDWKLCRVTLRKAEGMRKWENDSTRHNSLIIASGVMRGTTMKEVNHDGDNIDDLCGKSGHKTLAFRFELFGISAVRPVASSVSGETGGSGGGTGGSGAGGSGSGEPDEGGETGGNSGSGDQDENNGGGENNGACGDCEERDASGACVALSNGMHGPEESRFCCWGGVRQQNPTITQDESGCYVCNDMFLYYVASRTCCELREGRKWACKEDTGSDDCCCLSGQVVENNECHNP